MVISRDTRQKKIISSQVALMTTFFSAQELFDAVVPLDSKIGKATVYRFLQRLHDQGQIHSFECRGVTVYSMTATMHCHFVCEKCGNIEHFVLSSVSFLSRDMQRRACHVQVTVDGLCVLCVSKQK